MVRYFIKTGFRSIVKHRIVSFIGILSLSVGISVLLLIEIFTSNELNVDRIHHKASCIYKVSYGNSSFTPGPLSNTLLENFHEIQHATLASKNIKDRTLLILDQPGYCRGSGQ